jgi:hypothetical protein
MFTIRYYNYWNVEEEKQSTNSTTTPHLSESMEQRVERVFPQAEESSVIFGDMEGSASRVGVGSWCALSSSVSPGAAGKESGEVEPLHNELGRSVPSPDGVEGPKGSSFEFERVSTNDDSSSALLGTSMLSCPVLTLSDRVLFSSLIGAVVPEPDPVVVPFPKRALQPLASLSQLPLLELLGLSARTLASK